MRYQKTLSALSAATLLLTQAASAAQPCIVHVAAGADPAAAGYAAAIAQSGACVQQVTSAEAAAAAAAEGAVVTGVSGDAAVAAIKAAAPAAVIVAPQTQAPASRGYDSQVYHANADPVSEVVGSLAYVQPARVAVMQVAGAGMDAIAVAASQAAGSDAAVYSATSADAADIDEAQYAAVVAASPDAIVVAGPSGAQASAFVRRIVQEPSVIASGAAIVAPAAMQVSVLAAYAEAAASGAAVVAPSSIVFSTTNPVANDARYQAVADFKADIGAAAASYNTAEQTAALSGWIAGKVAQQIVSRYGSSASGVEAGMSGQNRFIVSDIVVGDYAGACPSNVRGIACECNQGGRTIYISTATAAADGSIDIAPVPSADYTYPNSACYATEPVTADAAAIEGFAHPIITAALGNSTNGNSTNGTNTTAAPKPYTVPINCDADRALLIICIVVSLVIIVVVGGIWVLSRLFSKEFNNCFDCVEEHNPVDVIMRVCPSWCG